MMTKQQEREALERIKNIWRSDEHTALERAQSRADAAEAEIIRLKAKLYDFMTAAKD
jgi:hypothetical protein